MLKQQTPIVCFVTGHGEPYGVPGSHAHLGHTETLEGAVTTLEAPATGIDRLTMAIEAIGYSDHALDMPTVRIQADCAVVMDVGPRTSLLSRRSAGLEELCRPRRAAFPFYDPEFR